MTHVADGRTAEQAAADYIARLGYEIIVRNWRTRQCELDIVARKGAIIYICEVKYRRTTRQGSGIDYLTPRKLRHLAFAAQSWVHAHAWRGEYRVCAIEVSGPRFQVTGLVDIDY